MYLDLKILDWKTASHLPWPLGVSSSSTQASQCLYFQLQKPCRHKAGNLGSDEGRKHLHAVNLIPARLSRQDLSFLSSVWDLLFQTHHCKDN